MVKGALGNPKLREIPLQTHPQHSIKLVDHEGKKASGKYMTIPLPSNTKCLEETRYWLDTAESPSDYHNTSTLDCFPVT